MPILQPAEAGFVCIDAVSTARSSSSPLLTMVQNVNFNQNYLKLKERVNIER